MACRRRTPGYPSGPVPNNLDNRQNVVATPDDELHSGRTLQCTRGDMADVADLVLYKCDYLVAIVQHFGNTPRLPIIASDEANSSCERVAEGGLIDW